MKRQPFYLTEIRPSQWAIKILPLLIFKCQSSISLPLCLNLPDSYIIRTNDFSGIKISPSQAMLSIKLMRSCLRVSDSLDSILINKKIVMFTNCKKLRSLPLNYKLQMNSMWKHLLIRYKTTYKLGNKLLKMTFLSHPIMNK